ncbi:MAG TPA: hypothetical protein VL494_13790 [Steroidobacteraceae bacterium]|jgi:hypothetical protein|nr:hypothetical protein [Steroidobacteraceae bacterium]
MTLSAEFSVNSDPDVQEHIVAYGGSVALAALSQSFTTIAWEISSGSKSGATAPTITLSGAPLGVTASFTQVADPGDGLGRAWVVKCTQTDAAGATSVAYRVVGTRNVSSLLPICADEGNYRDSTHGWSQVINALLAASGGGATGDVTGPGSSTNGDLPSFNGTTGKVLQDSGVAAADVVKRTGTVPFTGNQSMGSHKLTSVTQGTVSGDAVAYPVTNSEIDAAAAIALSKLASGTACSVVTRSANSTGALGLTSIANNDEVLMRTSNALTSGKIANANVSSSAAIDGTKISPDFGSQVVRTTGQFVGATSGTPTATSDAGSFESCTTGSGSLRGLCHRQASADANGARVVLQKCRGTHASPSAHSADDHLGSMVARGYDGASFYDAGILRFVGDAAGGTSKRTRFESQLHNGTALITGEVGLQAVSTTTDATLTTVYSISVAADAITSIAIRWAGKQSGSSNRAFRETTLAVRRNGSGNVTEYSHSDGVSLQKDDATWGDSTQIGYALNTGTQAVDIKVQGKAATTIDWTIDVVYSHR